MYIWHTLIWLFVLFAVGMSVGTMSKYWKSCDFATTIKLLLLLPIQTVYASVLLYDKIMKENNSKSNNKSKKPKRPFMFSLRFRYCVVIAIMTIMPSISSLLAHEQTQSKVKIDHIIRRTKNDVYEGLEAKGFCFS